MHVSYRPGSVLRLALFGTWTLLDVGRDAVGDAARKVATRWGQRAQERYRRMRRPRVVTASRGSAAARATR
jgi:hypothetical protein